MEPETHALAGEFFIIEPPGKPRDQFFFFFNIYFYLLIWLHRVLVVTCGI